ncbi:MAG: hypothetical protein JXA22_03820 [Candidatus Thermoplasmatota archaeon]|nr:hypothetical protein [Candidatus Thermoplasmatota archaeon]
MGQKVSRGKGHEKGPSNRLDLSLRSVLDDLSMDTSARSLLDIDVARISMEDSLVGEYERDGTVPSALEIPVRPVKEIPVEPIKEEVVVPEAAPPIIENEPLDLREIKRNDDHLRLLKIITNELIGRGISPREIEELLIEAFTDSAIKGSGGIRDLDPGDEKEVRKFLKHMTGNS